DLAVRSQAPALLRRQYHVRLRAGEEREQAPLLALLGAACRAEELAERGLVELARLEERARAEERRRRRGAGRCRARRRRRRGLGQCQRALDAGEVGVRARLGVVGLEPGEEAARCALTGREAHGLVLDRGQRVLVLAAHAREARRLE